MNPLQKKCVIATAGVHLLLLLILFVGPGFFNRAPKPDNLPLLKVIPLTAIDAAMSSGSAAATPPPAAPPQPVVTPPPPAPEPVKPVVQPEPTPTPTPPEPKPPEPKPEEPTPVPDTPADVPTPEPKPKPHVIDVDISKPVVRKVAKNSPDTHAEEVKEERAERAAERAAERQRELAVSRITSGLRDNLTSSTEVQMPGAGSASYANYGQIVKSIYYDAWILPNSSANDESSPKVRVVIARDGTVISAHIIDPSGDAAVDASVRQALDRVTFIRPFPDGATEKERSYIIKFDLQTKRML